MLSRCCLRVLLLYIIIKTGFFFCCGRMQCEVHIQRCCATRLTSFLWQHFSCKFASTAEHTTVALLCCACATNYYYGMKRSTTAAVQRDRYRSMTYVYIDRGGVTSQLLPIRSEVNQSQAIRAEGRPSTSSTSRPSLSRCVSCIHHRRFHRADSFSRVTQSIDPRRPL